MKAAVEFANCPVCEGRERWRDIATAVLRNRGKSVAEIITVLQERYGEIGEIADGDELNPSETTWYFAAPKR